MRLKIFSISLFTTFTFLPYLFLIIFANSLSFSITINSFGFFFNNSLVKLPVPGPISNIISFLVILPYETILDKIFVF